VNIKKRGYYRGMTKHSVWMKIFKNLKKELNVRS
jgi:hypothetical protein